MDIEKIKYVVYGIAFGAFALFGIGFGMGGWVLGGTAQANAEMAVLERLTPICVAQYQRDPQKAKKTKAMKDISYGQQGEYVASQGWATMPGESKPDTAVAEKCGDQISG